MNELQILRLGKIEPLCRILGSSNGTFMVRVRLGREWHDAIYKPESGERPLWDFPSGLYQRELAAYLLSEHLHWGLVPPTVVRRDGPYGVGSLQWLIEVVERDHYFTLYADDPSTHDVLMRIAVFDCITNNTDRKSGHVLRDRDGRVWAIDHGLCFAAEDKLRTVIWDFGGCPLPDALLADLAPLADEIPAGVEELISKPERVALRRRVLRLLEAGVLPVGGTGRRLPYPLV